MEPTAPRSRWLDAAWLLVLGLASSAYCVAAARHLSATFDEPCYVERGLHHWRTGGIKPLMKAGTMPLPVDVQTLPLYLWERHRGEPFHAVRDLDRLLPVARLANLPFWWLLLLYALRLGAAFGGPWAGRLAAGLVAADPNFLAHAALATTDIALTATVLMAAYHFHAGAGRGWGRRVFVPGVCFGLAVLAKGSALAFVPLAFAVIGLCRLSATGALATPSGLGPCGKVRFFQAATSPLRRDIVWAMGIGFVLVFAYCGSEWKRERTFVEWANRLPAGSAKAVFVPVSENLTVFTNAGEGIAQQVKHNMQGHGVYLRGEWHRRAVWYYFPVALTAKLPLPALVLLAVVLVARPRAFFSPVGWVAVALLAFSLNCRVQIGIRLVFPLVAFLLIALAVAAARSGRRLAWFAAGCAVATAAAAVWVWPHGLRYTNQFWGGPADGYRTLSDSNYDWGQGLKELERWPTDPCGPPLAVWYYGMDPGIHRPTFRNLELHNLPIKCGEDVRVIVGPRQLAVGASLLYGHPAPTPAGKAAIDWLRQQKPVGRTATFFVFDLK